MQWLAKHLAEPNPEFSALMADSGASLVGANPNNGDDVNALSAEVARQHTLWFEILRDGRSG